jgi:ribosome-associated toxin RatA of RatAB toxin-antitoxin module
MKDLQGTASTAVSATPEECIAVLAAVDRYPTWYPDVIRQVEVLQRDSAGLPRRAKTTVHLSVGPLANDYHFEVTVEVQPGAVILARVPDEPFDEERLEVRWQVRPRQLGVEVVARLDVPRFLPLGSAGPSVAQGFVEAAKRVLDGSSPNVSASSS